MVTPLSGENSSSWCSDVLMFCCLFSFLRRVIAPRSALVLSTECTRSCVFVCKRHEYSYTHTLVLLLLLLQYEYILLVLCCIPGIHQSAFSLGGCSYFLPGSYEPAGDVRTQLQWGSGFGLICLQVFRFLLCDRHLLQHYCLCTSSLGV